MDYGLDHDDILKAVCAKADEYRQALGLTTVSGFLRQAIRQDIYDTVFLNTSEDPWSTVLMNKQERYTETHLFRSRMAEYMINGVYEYTGLSFSEFIKLPTYLVEHTFSTLRQMKNETRVDGKKMEKELEKQSLEFSNLKKR